MDTMSTKLNSLLQSIRSSGLNFSCQETPWSIYVTLRKSYVKHRDHQTPSSVVTDSVKENLSTEHELKLLKFEFAKLLASHEELKKAHQNVNSEFEETLEDLQDKTRTIEELAKKSYELESRNKMLSVNNKNLEIKVIQVSTENKDLKIVVTNVKTELKEESKELKFSRKDQGRIEHNLNKKIEELELKVKNLLEDKVAKASEEKKIKKKARAIEKKEAEIEVAKLKIERKVKLKRDSVKNQVCQTDHHPDLPLKISEPLPPIFSSQFCFKTPMIRILSRSLPRLDQICWTQEDEDPYLDGAEEFLNWQHEQDMKQFYLDARQVALDKRVTNNNNIAMMN